MLAAPFIAPDGQRAQGVAVIALAACHKAGALGLAHLHKVLARHLECGLHGFGAAGDKVHIAQACRRVGCEMVGQLFCHGTGEEAGVGIRQLVELGVHGRQYIRVAVPQAGDRCAAAGVDVALAVAVRDEDTLGALCDAGGREQGAMNDMCHGAGSGGVG
ncbi:hypothetical protein D3C78_1221250 [compost metagenome]